jgi:chromosome segregation ATPase
MLEQINQLIGFIFAGIGFACALYYLMRSSKLEKAVMEILEHAESLKTDCETLFNKVRTSEEKIIKADTKVAELEKLRANLLTTDADNHKKISDLEIVLKNKDNEIHKMQANTTSIESAAQTHVKSLDKQLNELKAENYELLKKMDIVETTIKGKAVKDITLANTKLKEKELELQEAIDRASQIDSKVSAMETKLLETQNELSRVSETLTEPHKAGTTITAESQSELQAQVERYKKRLQRSTFFFNTMRGQKEMAEERYKNWEVALDLLSGWVLKQKNAAVNSSSLGPKVGEALAQINKEAILGELALDNNAEDEFSAILGASAAPPSQISL